MCCAAAMAPDLDLLGRFFDGENHHQHETHSLGAALLAALATVLLARVASLPRLGWLGVGVGLSWSSHVLLDWMAVDTSPPIGIMALWPLCSDYFHFSRPIFMDIGRTLDWQTFRHDLLAVGWEFVVLVPVLLLAWRIAEGRVDGARV